MKKVVMFLGTMALALGLNAATVDWKVQITAATTADAYNVGYTAYLVDAAAWDALGTIKADAFTSSAVLDSTTFGAGTGKSSTNKSYTTVDGTGAANARSLVIGDLDVGSTKNVYYVILNTNTDPNSFTKISDTLTGRADNASEALGSNTSVMKASLSFTNVSGGDTPPSGVPEPTSGLLFLVGGAMLALRRKQK